MGPEEGSEVRFTHGCVHRAAHYVTKTHANSSEIMIKYSQGHRREHGADTQPCFDIVGLSVRKWNDRQDE